MNLKGNVYLSLIFILFAILITANSHSMPGVDGDDTVTEFDSIESIELQGNDSSAQRRVRRLIPRLYRRFCHLEVRPESVALSIALVEVTWSMESLCRNYNELKIKLKIDDDLAF